MTNSHKILIFCIIVQIGLTILAMFGQSGSQTDTDTAGTEDTIFDMQDESTLYQQRPEGQAEATTIGSSMTQSAGIWDIINRKGIKAFVYQHTEGESVIEQYLIYLVNYIRVVLMAVIGLEAYFIFVNKKTK